MRLSTAVTIALTVLLATAALGPVAASTAPSTPSTSHSSTPTGPGAAADLDRSPSTTVAALEMTRPATVQSQTQAPLPAADPNQIIRLNVSSNGDVRWEIESRFLVTDDDDADTFHEFADAVTTGRIDSGYDVSLFRQYVDQAETVTGREMELQNAGWDEPEIREPESDELVEDGTRIGVITYSFTWTNFAAVDGDRIYFGDALQSPDDDGSWLPLYEGQRLVVESPRNYALETPTELSWDGPHQFEDDELNIVFLRGPSGPQSALPSSVWLVGSALGILIAAGIGGYFAYRYATRSERELPIDRLPLLERVSASVESAARSADGTAGNNSSGSDSTGESDAGATTAAADAARTQLEYEEIDDDIDPELLSDEERVHRMLKRNGGRMKQATIVKETGWSNAKVSQLLSQMDEDGEIEKLRIGRENLITLPEVDPTEID